MIQRICVFCGSNSGSNPAFTESAQTFGAELAARGLGLVYGGGRVGLMGELANSVLKAGGEVVGVIPEALFTKEVGHTGLTQLHVVGTMHERKGMMAQLADAFVTLPGGFGTMEEFFEVLTWAQLGIHTKPCGLLNVAGYYDPLLALFDDFVQCRFARPEHLDFVLSDTNPAALLARLISYVAPTKTRWITDEEV
ncbi:MAG: TIGR00730 family Rossman fold protein [Bacteroidetes bacterium]|nr:TIGR00730 family Rossman fold protein [Bacteroidota bacterium]